MLETLAVPAEYVAGLGLEIIKKKVSDKIDEKKLHDLLNEYIGRQQKYSEICTIAEEIDFQGLVEYIQNDLIEDAYRSIFAVSFQEREKATGQVIEKASAHSMVRTEAAKHRVAQAVSTCINIIREFYQNSIQKQDYILAAEVVDAVRGDTKEVVFAAVDRLEEKISDKLEIIEGKVDSLSGKSLSENGVFANEIDACVRANKKYLVSGVDTRILPDIRLGDTIYSANESMPELLHDLWQREDKSKHIVLLAEGGMGKTTLLRHTISLLEGQAVLYISLEEIEASELRIEQYICRTLYGAGDLQDRLFRFTNEHRDYPNLILLLDGFNEISGDTQARYIKELRGLSEYAGVQIVVSSREDFTKRFSNTYAKAYLSELADEQVESVLCDDVWAHVKSKATLLKLLKNPMLLLMYETVCPVMNKHQNAFLNWITPIENETQLIHNYFISQMAVLLDRGDISGTKLICAYQCIGYALPFIAYHMENEGRLSVAEDKFIAIVDEAVNYANRCDYLIGFFRKIQMQFRIRTIPEIQVFDVLDFLVNEAHLIHENDHVYSFEHQMYRDYLSACRIVNDGIMEINIWCDRKLPAYLYTHIRNLSDRYWDGIAKGLAEAARGKDSSKIGYLISNIIDVFPYTVNSGVPDFSSLDLRSVRLRNYHVGTERIPMKGTKIDTTTLALSEIKPSIYTCLTFSEDGEWLAAIANGSLSVWSMTTGIRGLIYSENIGNAQLYFSKCGRYLFVNSNMRRESHNQIAVFRYQQEWKYACALHDVCNSRLRSAIIADNTLYAYYNNREHRYDLSYGTMCYNKQKKHAWEGGISGEYLPKSFIEGRPTKRLKREDGLICKAIRGELCACSYNDGTLEVCRNEELIHRLSIGVARLKAAAISGDGKWAVTLSQNSRNGYRRMQMWNLEKRVRCGERLVSDITTNVHLSASGKWIIGETNGASWVMNWRAEQINLWINESLVSNQHGKLTTYENKVLIKNVHNELEILDLDTSDHEKVKASRKNARIATFLPNGDIAVVGNNAFKAVFSGIENGTEYSINSENAAITGIISMRNQPFIGLATSNGLLSIYHTKNGVRTRKLETKSGNKIIVAHPNANVIACSGGDNHFTTFNLYSKTGSDGKTRSWWYENKMEDVRLDGNVLDMNFNESNHELVTIMSDGTIVYSHELYCRYHSSTRIITNFNVDEYDFTGAICEERIKSILKDNGAVL